MWKEWFLFCGFGVPMLHFPFWFEFCNSVFDKFCSHFTCPRLSDSFQPSRFGVLGLHANQWSDLRFVGWKGNVSNWRQTFDYLCRANQAVCLGPGIGPLFPAV